MKVPVTQNPVTNTLLAGFGNLEGFASTLEFLVHTGGAEETAAALREGGMALSYNRFRPEKLAQAVEAIHELHPSGHQLTFEFGREASPVLYVHVPYWRGGGENDQLTSTQRKELAQSIVEVLRTFTAPDELDVIDLRRFPTVPSRVRAWWD